MGWQRVGPDLRLRGGVGGGGWGGKRVGPDLHLWGGGGGVARGLHRNYFFPITFIVHNHMSIGGGAMGVGWGWARPPPL